MKRLGVLKWVLTSAFAWRVAIFPDYFQEEEEVVREREGRERRTTGEERSKGGR